MHIRWKASRKTFLALLGAVSVYTLSMMLNPPNSICIDVPLDIDLSVLEMTPFSNANTSKCLRVSKLSKEPLPGPLSPVPSLHKNPSTVFKSSKSEPIIELTVPSDPMTSLPHTSIIAHAPGWTLFRNLYMAGGTLLIVSPFNNSFPKIRMMTSPGYPMDNTPENIALREPTAEHMDFLTPEQADQRWKSSNAGSTAYRVWSIKGNTILFNDARQFLHHYYHFVAELFFGTWAFWYGAFTKPSSDLSLSLAFSDAPFPPPIHRLIFAHSDADGWHDEPGFDSYFLRAVFPHITVEDQRSWADLISATSARPSDPASQRAWHFPLVLLADRSAAFHGAMCGAQTQRTASEAWQYMFTRKKLIGIHAARWWDPLRVAMWKFAGVDGIDALNWMKQSFPRQGLADEEVIPSFVRQGVFQEFLPPPQKVTITYISRQSGNRRRLLREAHDDVVLSISELVARRKLKGDEWVFRVVDAGKLSRDEQIRIAAETTIMLGVHGNGLTHLVFMPPTRLSTVIEIFYPGGFAHDYQWTATAMGMKHFSIWNDTYFALPAEQPVLYPPGFQESSIPAHGPSIAKLIEDRVDGKI